MTTPATAVSPDARRIWRSARGPIAIAVLIVATGIIVGLARGTGDAGALDPRSPEPAGSRALARLLTEQGVHVRRADSVAAVHAALDAAAGAHGDLDDVPATLLITRPDWVAPEQLRALTSRTRAAVLIAPGRNAARALVPEVRVAEHTEVDDLDPECALDAATVAGRATIGGASYQSGRADARCYPTEDGFALLRVTRGDTPVTLLGTGTPLTNDVLDEQGNAALAMRLLGAHQRLVWYLPSLGDPTLHPGDGGAGERSLLELMPAGWKYGLAQVCIAVVLLALWRARRLGPLVSEPLPVVVHAAETTEGRARLYRKAGAADHAAAALRSAAAGRIAGRLGLPADAEPGAVTAAAAARAGRPPEWVRELLYGPPPAGDAALVRLADDLDSLENEVRTA